MLFLFAKNWRNRATQRLPIGGLCLLQHAKMRVEPARVVVRHFANLKMQPVKFEIMGKSHLNMLSVRPEANSLSASTKKYPLFS